MPTVVSAAQFLMSLDGFAAFLASRNDRLYMISDAHATEFDNVITVTGQTVRLDKDITDRSLVW